MRYLLNNNVYEMPRAQYNGLIKMLKERTADQNVILAIVKDNTAEARNDVYESTKELMAAVRKWTSDGYSVNYHRAKKK